MIYHSNDDDDLNQMMSGILSAKSIVNNQQSMSDEIVFLPRKPKTFFKFEEIVLVFVWKTNFQIDVFVLSMTS